MSRLRDARKALGYSQSDMQTLTGIHQVTISRIESGRREYTFEQCKRIALALNTSMDYLAGLTDEKEAHPRAEPKNTTGGR